MPARGNPFYFDDMYTIADIIDAIKSPDTQYRRLHGVEPTYNKGEIIYMTGNSSVVIPVTVEGQRMILKCYTRRKANLEKIYAERFLPRELTIRNILGQVCQVDCLLLPMLEGRTLDRVLCDSDIPTWQIADSFERMVMRLLAQEVAHGDIKPENIIMTNDGELHLIDWDAAFTPSMAGEEASEIGTAAYQHPKRTARLFNKHIDDYSIAYMLTTLRAAALDEHIREEYRLTYEFHPSPAEILSDKGATTDTRAKRFIAQAMVKEYRLSQMLLSPQPTLPMLTTILTPTVEWDATDDISVEQSGGLWGLRNDSGWVVAPLYDSIMEPVEGRVTATAAGDEFIISLTDKRTACLGRDVRAKLSASGELIITKNDGSRSVIPREEILQILGK